MKFSKLKASGLLKGPKNPTPDPSIPNTPTAVKPIKGEMSKFTGLKRSLAKERNLTKRFKI
jgi:hypothetical protein